MGVKKKVLDLPPGWWRSFLREVGAVTLGRDIWWCPQQCWGWICVHVCLCVHLVQVVSSVPSPLQLVTYEYPESHCALQAKA